MNSLHCVDYFPCYLECNIWLECMQWYKWVCDQRLTLSHPMTAYGVMVSRKLMGIYMGFFNTRRYTIVHGLCLFKQFLMGGKELKHSITVWEVVGLSPTGCFPGKVFLQSLWFLQEVLIWELCCLLPNPVPTGTNIIKQVWSQKCLPSTRTVWLASRYIVPHWAASVYSLTWAALLAYVLPLTVLW